MKNRTLFFFTSGFPFTKDETFLRSEFPYLQKKFGNIIIVSGAKANDTVLTGNVSLYSIYDIIKGKNRFRSLFSDLSIIMSFMFMELRNCGSFIFFLKNSRLYLNRIINSFICADFICSHPEFKRDACFYSYWMNEHAITLAVLRKQGKIDKALFRVHGYDLIRERWPHNYIAFQKVCHTYADRILTVSKKSLTYFRSTYGDSKKVGFSYLGSEDKGINTIENMRKEITLVSCSNIIPLKRLHLIIDTIKKMSAPVKWIHFGEGYLMNEILEMTKGLNKNSTIEFKGKVDQETLFDFYRSNPIDFFINVSDSEGLPFTIVEAISMGIPIIATDVGGTSEIVTSDTGILVPIELDTEKLARLLDSDEVKKYRAPEYRKKVRSVWERDFSAGSNIPRFIENELLS